MQSVDVYPPNIDLDKVSNDCYRFVRDADIGRDACLKEEDLLSFLFTLIAGNWAFFLYLKALFASTFCQNKKRTNDKLYVLTYLYYGVFIVLFVLLTGTQASEFNVAHHNRTVSTHALPIATTDDDLLLRWKHRVDVSKVTNNKYRNK